MLVITRKTEETIIINDNIEITILDIGKDRVKIGLNAPKEIKIVRKEIYNTEEHNKQASEALSPNIIAQLLNKNGKDENYGNK